MRVILRLLVYTCAVLITAWLLPGVHVENFITALMVAIALAILNTFIRPVLVFLTIPVTIVTMGFFLLVINALIIMLIGRIVPGFVVGTSFQRDPEHHCRSFWDQLNNYCKTSRT
jgi:putative membrane protein